MTAKKLLLLSTALFLFSGILPAEIRVATADAMKNATTKPTPEYNPLARQMRVAGDVVVEVKIADNGAVDAVEVVSGNSMLASTVVKTVKQWKFTPFESGGKPTAAVTTLKFNFKL